MGRSVRLRLVLAVGVLLAVILAFGARDSADIVHLRSRRLQPGSASHNPFAVLLALLNSLWQWIQQLGIRYGSAEDASQSGSGDEEQVYHSDSAPIVTNDPDIPSVGEMHAPYKGLAVPLEPLPLKDAGKIATIVGGATASPKDAPFFVMMLSWSDANTQWEFNGCGGTLISSRHVLTAGHCAVGHDSRVDAVYVGAYQPFWGNPGLKFHFSKVLSYTIHPEFNDGPNDSDVAVVAMARSVDTESFNPIRLAPQSMTINDGDMVRVYGFGRKDFASGEQVKTLQKVNLPFIDQSSCQDFYGTRVLDDMVCAGFSQGGKDACSGDSGGPMVVSRKGDVYQAGIVSWGDGCAEANKPGVYTSVQYHYEWIQTTVCRSVHPASNDSLCREEFDVLGGNVQGTYVPSDVPSLEPSMRPTAHPSNVPSPTPSVAPVRTPSCNLKPEGVSCLYGGECCSGACISAEGSSNRVCSGASAATEAPSAQPIAARASRKGKKGKRGR